MSQFPEEGFQYTRLNTETRTIVWQRTSEIKSLIRLTAENIIAIGQKLIEVKSQLEHGSFQSWLRAEFEWSEQTARQFMQVYRWSETVKNKNFVFSQLSTSALYLLAAPSTSPQARKEILDLIETDEKITYSRAKNIVDSYKEPKQPENTASEANELDRVIDVRVERSPEGKSSSNQLFRLETPNVGCIVRLYRGDELESDSELTIGSSVTIKVGTLQGQTAKIVDVLTDLQVLATNDAGVIEATSTQPDQIIVRTVDKTKYSDRQTMLEADRHLIVSYGQVCLSIEANSETLANFIKQAQTNSAFVQKIFELAREVKSS